MRVLRKATMLGVTLGFVLCAFCWWMEYRARVAPDGSDAPMAAALLFDVVPRPLSYLTGGVLYDLGLGSSVIANSLQVLLNSLLLLWLGALLWILASKLWRRQATPAE